MEIIRGPATLLYGSGAAGGLVNVVDTRFIEEPLDNSGGSLQMPEKPGLGIEMNMEYVAANRIEI